MSKLLWWCNYLIGVTELLFSICGGLLSAWPWGTPDGLVRGKKCGRHHSQICELKQKNKNKNINMQMYSFCSVYCWSFYSCDQFISSFSSQKNWWRPTHPLSTFLKWARRPSFGVRNKSHAFTRFSRYDLCLSTACVFAWRVDFTQIWFS